MKLRGFVLLCLVSLTGTLLLAPASAEGESWTGTYVGTSENFALGVSATVEIVLRDDHGVISGCASTQPPLLGSGPIQGQVRGDSLTSSMTNLNPMFVVQSSGRRSGDRVEGEYLVTFPDGSTQRGRTRLHRVSTEGLPSSFALDDCPTTATEDLREHIAAVPLREQTAASSDQSREVEASNSSEGDETADWVAPRPARMDAKDTAQADARLVGDLGVATGPIARNHEELQELIRRGDRNYYAFELRSGSGPQRVGPVHLELIHAIPGEQQYTLLVETAGRQIEKRRRRIYQAVQFYMGSLEIPCDVVIYAIESNRVVGYLSTPRKEVATGVSKATEIPGYDTNADPPDIDLPPPVVPPDLPLGSVPGAFGPGTGDTFSKSFPVVHHHKWARCWGTLMVSRETLKYAQYGGSGQDSFEILINQVASVDPWSKNQFEVKLTNGVEYHFAHGVMRNKKGFTLAQIVALRPMGPVIQAIQEVMAAGR